jgi:hypothetical protein
MQDNRKEFCLGTKGVGWGASLELALEPSQGVNHADKSNNKPHGYIDPRTLLYRYPGISPFVVAPFDLNKIP